MTFKRPYGAGLAALAVGMFAATAAYAEPTVNKGDNAWMLTSTVLVLLMTIPGLALFYGGLVRSKNMLSVLMQVFYTVCVVTVIWAVYGYSLAFTGGSDFIGGFQGQASDILIHANETQETKRRITRLYAQHSGRTEAEVERTLHRGHSMTARKGAEWGVVDRAFA